MITVRCCSEGDENGLKIPRWLYVRYYYVQHLHAIILAPIVIYPFSIIKKKHLLCKTFCLSCLIEEKFCHATCTFILFDGIIYFFIYSFFFLG